MRQPAGRIEVRREAQREMVHADVAIPRRGQRLDREPEQRQARGRIGQLARFDLPLRFEPLGQMRVSVGGDAIGLQRDDFVQCMREVRRRLSRQPVDQIDAGRAKTIVASSVEHGARLLHALNSIDGRLHVRIEILDADRQAVEAVRGEHPHVLRTGIARIELDTELAVGASVEREVLIQRFKQISHLPRVEEIRRATAEMELHDRGDRGRTAERPGRSRDADAADSRRPCLDRA